MSIHRKKGATLGLMPAIILLMVIIGMAAFYFAQFFGGNKELVNATDAGALATARNILAIGLASNEVQQLPPEFQALGVDNTGAPVSINPATGAPDLSNAIFNVYAFNRAAGLTLLVALNAAEEGSPGAINNANALIAGLNTFGTKLNNDLHNDPSFATAFVNLTSNNNTSMLGNSTISLANNDQVQFASIPNDGTGKANIYFNSAIYQNDPQLQNWIQQITVNSGTMSQPNSRYNASDLSAQANQPFVAGYKALDITGITGVNGFTPLIYACAVNPSQLPHMIDQGRFNNSSASVNCYAPNNATLAQANANDNRTNLLCSALGCAMLGANDNQYPIGMPFGWIRIKNNPDAITANATQSPSLPSVPLWIDSADMIFNNELWLGAGGYGGINIANNSVFCTESFDDPSNAFDSGPPGYSGSAELSAWVTYNTTPCTNPLYKDSYGQDSRLNPNLQQPDGSYVLGYASPTVNIRVSANYEQIAAVSDMRGVTSILGYCNSDMYGANTPPVCLTYLNTWLGNYKGPTTGVNGLSAGPFDSGTQPTGGLTNLEYLKGEVIGAYWNVIVDLANQVTPPLTYTLNTPQLPSGCKKYTRTDQIAYSVPSDTHSVAFGTVSTPYDLLVNQLYTYNASCANADDGTQWSDITTPLGKLLQRCQQILPSAAASDITALLKTYPIDLNQYQYIYLPVGGSKLTISKTPPIWLKSNPEYNSPGVTIPDGTGGSGVIICKDSNWDDSGTYIRGQGITPISISNNIVNSIKGAVNTDYGDGYSHLQPYDTFQGNLNTYDAVNWTSNSGRNFFLGELSFGTYANGTSGTYSAPN